MVTKFEETGSLNVCSGRGKKPVSTEAIEKVALQVEEDKSSNVLDSTSVRRVAEALDLPRSTVQKIMRNTSSFLARLQVDPEWPWNILWTDEAHFHLDRSVNTHNCRIWETDNPHSTLRVPLHSPKVTVWCGFSASFILGPYFFEELGAGGPVTCSVTGQRYASLLRNKIIPDLQAHQCLSRIIFMQDGAPPHITRCVKDVLKHHFTEERVISRQFRHLWPPRSPDLNPCDLWLWGHLKQLVSCYQPKTLPDLKDSISRHVLNISQNILRSTVEHAMLP
ncbi:transposable element tc3 transposase [Trichonephila clavipes]|uniref:Transposable element tc3 transposase n=1 Tax=Trichonephila clavipes TaxID=2585209 RepID=A0A8X6VYZ4_TRICX|nr:transposable element tc3 transposase [Trichonephila clavipes]